MINHGTGDIPLAAMMRQFKPIDIPQSFPVAHIPKIVKRVFASIASKEIFPICNRLEEEDDAAQIMRTVIRRGIVKCCALDVACIIYLYIVIVILVIVSRRSFVGLHRMSKFHNLFFIIFNRRTNYLDYSIKSSVAFYVVREYLANLDSRIDITTMS